ncbi:MAG: hypothetical protein ACYS1A_15805 [Planctomycetota bacterium]|jgi:hypothetical protein
MKRFFINTTVLSVVFVMLATIWVAFTPKNLRPVSNDQMDSIYGGAHYPCQICVGSSTQACEAGFYTPSICNQIDFTDDNGIYGPVGYSGCHPIAVETFGDCARTNHCRRNIEVCESDPLQQPEIYCWAYTVICSTQGSKYKKHRCASNPGPGLSDGGSCECELVDSWVDCEGTFPWCNTV